MRSLQKRNLSPYLLVASLSLLVGFLSLLPEMVLNGGVFFSRTDYVEQQIPYLLETKRMLESGTPFWSWNSFLGDNFIGSYSYNLGSPFVYLILWLPEHLIPAGMTAANLLKFMVCGITSFAFLRRFVKKDSSAVVGALLYTFSGYTVINTQFNHFTDVIAVFPLLLLGMELLFSKDAPKRRPYGFFAFAVFLNAMINYYLFVGSVLFAALYFFFRLFSGGWERKEFARYRRFFTEGVLGVGMSACLLLPSVLRMLSTPKAMDNVGRQIWDTLPLNQYLERLRTLFMPIESLSRHAFFNNAASYASVSAYLAVFGGVLAIVFCVTQWKKENGWLAKFLPFLILISLVPGLNSAFILFSENTYTRWWYALALMLSLATVLTLEQLPEMNPKIPLRTFWGVLGALAVVLVPYILAYAAYKFQWFPNWEYLNSLSRYYREDWYNVGGFETMAFSLGLTAVNYLCLWFLLKRKSPKKLVLCLVALCCALNYSGFNYFNNTTRSKGYDHESFGPGEMPISYHLEHVFNPDRPNSVGKQTYSYRVDFPPLFIRNYGMYNNEPAVDAFSSIRNASTAEFITFAKYFGYQPSAVFCFPQYQDREYIDTFLSVKQYKIFDPQRDTYVPAGFVKTETTGGVDVYENQNYLPMGFTYDLYLSRSDVEAAEDPKTNITARNLLNALILEDKDVERFSEFLFPAAVLTKAEEFPSLQEMADARRLESCDRFEGTSSGFQAHITLSRKNLVFFTVPYDQGFTATVNGKPAEIIKCNMGFSAVLCEEGESSIEFTYRTPGLNAGLAASGSCAVLLTGYCLAEHLRGRKRKAREPEM